MRNEKRKQGVVGSIRVRGFWQTTPWWQVQSINKVKSSWMMHQILCPPWYCLHEKERSNISWLDVKTIMSLDWVLLFNSWRLVRSWLAANTSSPLWQEWRVKSCGGGKKLLQRSEDMHCVVFLLLDNDAHKHPRDNKKINSYKVPNVKHPQNASQQIWFAQNVGNNTQN